MNLLAFGVSMIFLPISWLEYRGIDLFVSVGVRMIDVGVLVCGCGCPTTKQ